MSAQPHQIDPEVINTVAKFAQVGMRVLTARALTWTTMLLTAAMFGYCVFVPDVKSLAAATIFGLLVFWRVTWLEKSNSKGVQNG